MEVDTKKLQKLEEEQEIKTLDLKTHKSHKIKYYYFCFICEHEGKTKHRINGRCGKCKSKKIVTYANLKDRVKVIHSEALRRHNAAQNKTELKPTSLQKTEAEVSKKIIDEMEKLKDEGFERREKLKDKDLKRQREKQTHNINKLKAQEEIKLQKEHLRVNRRNYFLELESQRDTEKDSFKANLQYLKEWSRERKTELKAQRKQGLKTDKETIQEVLKKIKSYQKYFNKELKKLETLQNGKENNKAKLLKLQEQAQRQQTAEMLAGGVEVLGKGIKKSKDWIKRKWREGQNNNSQQKPKYGRVKLNL